jgi:cytochrome b involved in lipid metabolism
MSKQFTKAEVAQHKDENGMYIIIDDGVYDIASRSSYIPSSFLNCSPRQEKRIT